MAMLLGLLLAFSSFPGANELRPAERARPSDRALYPARLERLVPSDRIDFNASETAQPVFDEAQTRLYLTTRDGRVRCQFEGRTAWLWKAAGSLLATPLLAGDTLYVPGSDGLLTALNRITGEVRWQTDLREELTTSPAIAEGRLFVMSSEDAVTAVELETGKSLWKFRRERPGGFTLRGNARPVVAHGLVYTAFADGTVAALKPSDGAARWVRTLGTGDYLDVDSVAAPADDPRIYVASAREGIVALVASSGDVAWTAALPGANHVTVDGPRVYGTGRGAVVGLARRSGALLWTAKLARERYATEPVAIGGLVLVSEERGALLALEAASGRARSAYHPGSGFSMPAVAMRGAAFLVSNEGVLVSFGLLP